MNPAHAEDDVDDDVDGGFGVFYPSLLIASCSDGQCPPSPHLTPQVKQSGGWSIHLALTTYKTP